MIQFSGDDMYIKNVSLTDELLHTLNNELAEHGLPNAWNFLAFKRRNSPKSFQVHVDYSGELDCTISSSIVFPISGCENTAMYWVDGQYQLSKITQDFGTYTKLSWTSSPRHLDEVEIANQTMLCRVDVPHSAYNHSRDVYRTILSVRLQGNPDFDDVITKIL
jgi:hypothetical protein